MDGLRQPWGQLAAFGMALFVAVEIFEHPLGHIRSLPPYFAEEALELVSSICIFLGLVAQCRALMLQRGTSVNVTPSEMPGMDRR
jgi:hypothetical protein